ncbi:lysophospholipid acyltransferase family protein [Flavobacteriaceae bacterium F89]|uniref:Lysophospholipid acyltransferase family protein n=1 Tax=Cerina litoralis TaxID=2874477 RepID=A0AAE3JQV0_9FLAO|nr:lysophospholipid acyltransferase family protein [Cerina litoralis]MCG2462269.1 lysophospholipid acyltransferase family protein [Cerina litoralis]
MRKFLYLFCKQWVILFMHLYFKEIRVFGKRSVPKGKPVLFIANHQNALMDAMQVVVDRGICAYFMTRADVFEKPILRKIFTFLQMLPIYRIRDGKRNMVKNQEVFERCSQLLLDNNYVLIFPEGNHNLKRQVRPLSKGFTRILFSTLEKNPGVDIQLVPVGMNYQSAAHFPDRCSHYFGKPIPVQEFYDSEDLPGSALRIRDRVQEELQTLTTHIGPELDYKSTVDSLDALGVDYLKPKEVNATLLNLGELSAEKPSKGSRNLFSRVFKFVFETLNYPLIGPWRKYIKPKIKEKEFVSSARFLYCMIFYPLFYLLLLLVVWPLIGPRVAFLVVLGFILFNAVYVKLGGHEIPFVG